MNRAYEQTRFGSLFSALSSLLAPTHGARGSLPQQRHGLEARLDVPRAEEVLATLRLWRRRARQRLELQGLDDHILQDVGLTREQVLAEARKPFWRA